MLREGQLGRRRSVAAGSRADQEIENVYLVQSRPETVWSRLAPTAVTRGRTVLESIHSHLVPDPDPAGLPSR